MDKLKKMGVGELFAPGATMTDVAIYIKNWVEQNRNY
jgi:methylmalonyl-CoA mutase C-terminal domain/subunit